MITPTASFPVFIVEDIAAALKYYQENFDFSPVFEADWYIHLVSSHGVQLGFLAPNHPTQPEKLHHCHKGEGSIFTFEVNDVDSAFEEVKTNNLNLVQALKTEDWGQRHFILEDPNKVMIDVVQNTEPTEEYRADYK
jgi:uncharacterized glyoxalase superfamily protein PhnB